MCGKHPWLSKAAAPGPAGGLHSETSRRPEHKQGAPANPQSAVTIKLGENSSSIECISGGKGSGFRFRITMKVNFPGQSTLPSLLVAPSSQTNHAGGINPLSPTESAFG